MVALRIHVEGGGTTRAQQAKLREGFAQLFAKLSEKGPKPKVICGGSRTATFNDFCCSLGLKGASDQIWLLVDSEGPVEADTAWEHVGKREGDKWKRPAGAAEAQLHFMVEAMESWIASDPEALEAFYGAGFKRAALLPSTNLEDQSKRRVLGSLEAATRNSGKGTYAKDHAFDVVGRIDPEKIRRRCPKFGERFFSALKTLLDPAP